MGLLLAISQALWVMLPAYLANMLPVFVGGGTPIDMGRNWRDGKRILGNGKTWRGLLLAPALAVVIIFFLRLLPGRVAFFADFPTWGPDPWWAVFAYAIGFGGLAGDAVESFFKRRTGRDRGDPWFPFDQLDFVVGGLVFGAITAGILALVGVVSGGFFFEQFTPARLLVIVLLTPVLHLLVNFIGYKIGAKDVPW